MIEPKVCLRMVRPYHGQGQLLCHYLWSMAILNSQTGEMTEDATENDGNLNAFRFLSRWHRGHLPHGLFFPSAGKEQTICGSHRSVLLGSLTILIRLRNLLEYHEKNLAASGPF